MARQKRDNILIKEFWDRIENEIRRQNITKKQLAKRCRFDRKILSGHKTYMRTAYFARLCAELYVSADHLLLGEERKGV